MPLIDRMLSKTPGIGLPETPRAPEGAVGTVGAPSTAVSNLMKKAPDAVLR